MHDFATTVLWVYIVLLLVGGLIGFFKAKSKVSLITSAVFAALLVLTALPGFFNRRSRADLANVIMAVLLVVFAVRLAKTKKFMPSGLMLVLTIAALALRNLFQGLIHAARGKLCCAPGGSARKFLALLGAPIAQLDRASDYGSEGFRFNS